jgi:DNA polymerase-4
MPGAGTATVLHADLDAFYASVEQQLEPRLRRRPIAVGGGVVLAASYEARAFGVRAGMAGWRARQLCPDLVFVPGHFLEYQRLGDQVMGVFEAFTPLVERISIDEAFLDVAGAARLFGSPPDIAAAIRRRVRAETGLPVSIGVASTKHLAKVASQVAKPDGIVVVAPGKERQILHHLPVELLWGVGPATRARLSALGIRTVGELAAAPGTALEHLLGRAAGSKLASLAVNNDPRHIDTGRRASSMGAQAALGRRVATPVLLRTTLGYLADRVGGRLRETGVAGRTVTVRVRFTNLRSVTRAVTLSAPVSATLPLAELATELATTALADHPGERVVTLLGMSVANLSVQSALQLELPLDLDGDRYRPGSPIAAARFGADRSVDAVRARFGRGAVGYASAIFSDVDRVPEAFRELAEHRPPATSEGDTAMY